MFQLIPGINTSAVKRHLHYLPKFLGLDVPPRFSEAVEEL